MQMLSTLLSHTWMIVKKKKCCTVNKSSAFARCLRQRVNITACYSGQIRSICANGDSNTTYVRGEEQGSKSPFSPLSDSISHSSLLIQVHSVQFSLLPTFLCIPSPYFFPLFLPPPNFFGPFPPLPYSVPPLSCVCLRCIRQLLEVTTINYRNINCAFHAFS